MADRDKGKRAFLEYAEGYDVNDIMISLKIDHTMRVVDNIERIARSLNLSEEDVDLSWFIGLLHDFGRFEQITRYGTFIDAHSVDHAGLGADLLFKEGKIGLFTEAGISEESLDLVETAIRQHNQLKLSDDLDDRTRLFCNLLRDADKVDIFRVIDEVPFEQRAGTSLDLFEEKPEASPECMDYARQHRCIPRSIARSRFERHISHICLAFELVFNESRIIVREQGYLKRLFSVTNEEGERIWNDREGEQLLFIQEEIEKSWGMKL